MDVKTHNLTFANDDDSLYFDVTFRNMIFTRPDYSVFTEFKSERYKLLYKSIKALMELYLSTLKDISERDTEGIFSIVKSINLEELGLLFEGKKILEYKDLQEEIVKEFGEEIKTNDK